MHKITGVPTLSKALFKDSDPYRQLLPLLAQSSGPEDPIPLLTSHVLVNLIAGSRDESDLTLQKALPVILSYLSTLTKSSDAGLQDIGVQEYSTVLFGSKSRSQFWAQRSETVAPLINILRAAAGSSNGDANGIRSGSMRGGPVEGSIGGGVGLQLLYHVLLVMWQLSFEAEDVGCDLDEYVAIWGFFFSFFFIPVANRIKHAQILTVTFRIRFLGSITSYNSTPSSLSFPPRKRLPDLSFRRFTTFSRLTDRACCQWHHLLVYRLYSRT